MKSFDFEEAIFELAFGDSAISNNYSRDEVVKMIRDFSDKALHLDKMISGEAFTANFGMRFASGTFLTSHLTDDIINGDEDEYDQFVTEHAWEPFEYSDANTLSSHMDGLGYAHKDSIKTLAASWEKSGE